MTENRDSLTQDGLTHSQRRARRPNVTKKFYRSEDNILGGVAGGLAEYIGANPRNVRIVFVVSLLWTFGFFTVPYLMLWWLLPTNKLPTNKDGR
jgi:phage shock protein PspC (stress-responsive transcriptional regulator)